MSSQQRWLIVGSNSVPILVGTIFRPNAASVFVGKNFCQMALKWQEFEVVNEFTSKYGPHLSINDK